MTEKDFPSKLEGIVSESNTPKKKVLIVDDNKSWATALDLGLREYYDISIAATVEEAEQILANTHFDATILDYNLPGEKGDTLLDKINSETPQTSVIMVTGQGDTELAVELMKRGASDYLTKPVGFKKIRESIEKSFEKKNAAMHDRSSLRKTGTYKIIERNFGVEDLRKKVNGEIESYRAGVGGRERRELSEIEAFDLVTRDKILGFGNAKVISKIREGLQDKYHVVTTTDSTKALEILARNDVAIIINNDGNLTEEFHDKIRQNSLQTKIIDLLEKPRTFQFMRKEIAGYVHTLEEGYTSLRLAVSEVLMHKEMEESAKQDDLKRIDILEKKLEANWKDAPLHCQLGILYRYINPPTAYNYFLEAFNLDPKNVIALNNLAQMVDEGDIPKIPFPFDNFQRNILLMSQSNENVEPKLNAAKVMSMTSGNLKSSIDLYKQIVANNPLNLEGLVGLGIAYLKNGQKEMAEKVFIDLVRNLPKDDLSVGLEHLSDYEEGSEVKVVLAEISQHKVYGIVSQHKVYGVVSKNWTSDFVLKVYDRKFRENAEREEKNLVTAYTERDQLMLLNGNYLRIPQIIFSVHGEEYSLLILERIKGNKIDGGFVRSTPSDQLIHLEQTIDATVILSDVLTQNSSLRDVKSYKCRVPGVKRNIGFYTQRFVDKFVGQFKEYRGVSISKKQLEELVKLHQPIQKALTQAPDFLSLFYSDCNFRNFLEVEETQASHFEAVERKHATKSKQYIEHMQRARIDLESGDKRMMLLDIITAAEHEFYKDASLNNSRYLIRRAVIGLIARRTDREDIREHIYGVLKPGVEVDPRNKVREVLQKYLPIMLSSSEEFTLNDLDTLTVYASAQRHLTVLGDKVRDLHVIENKIASFKQNYPTEVVKYGVFMGKFMRAIQESARKNLLESLERDPKLDRSDKLLNVYIRLINQEEEIRSFYDHHANHLIRALKLTKNNKFLEKLDQIYGIQGGEK